MDKQAENTFVGGLNTDRHPLTSQTNELTNARNIDLIAIGEGYQLILQKREGNQELFFLPSAWNALSKYLTNEYVTELNTTYKSLVDNNINIDPATHPGSWQPQATVLVPAGLRPGFIPLAVKEFNEVAYIISVQPSSGVGEIGTFPSPDYTQFIYTKGTERVGAAVIDHADEVYDPRSNPPDYEFNIAPVAHSGDDEPVQSEYDVTMKVTLVKGGFRINNTGALPDVFTLARSVANANVVTKVNGVAYAYGVDTISIFPGMHADITFEIQHPFVAIYDVTNTFNVGMYATDGVDLYISIQANNIGHTPASSPLWWTSLGVIADYVVNTLVNTTITITSAGLPLDIQTYNFKYHLAPEIAIRHQTDPAFTYVFGNIGTPGDLAYRVPQIGGSDVFEWITNDATMVQSLPPLVTSPALVGATAFAALYQVAITFLVNLIPTICHTVGFYMIGTFSASGTEPGGTTTVNIYSEQAQL